MSTTIELQVITGEDRMDFINQLIQEGKFDRMSDFMREAVDEKLIQLGYTPKEYKPNFSKLKLRRYRGHTLDVVKQLYQKKYQTIIEIHQAINKPSLTSINIYRILKQLQEHNIANYELKIGISRQNVEMLLQNWFII